MSRGSSASSSSNVIITDQNLQSASSQSAKDGALPLVNGASVSSPPASSVPAPVDASKNVPLNTDPQSHAALDITATPIPDTAADTPLGTPRQAAVDTSTTTPAKDSNQAASTTTSSIPKARLPHDKIGMLEDRIKVDPRGDIEAWLSLIDEHKKRAKLDDARSTYDRFLAIFPFAVCSPT